ncbi:MAG: sulfatase [Elusimicrobia bacterium]|nr:sulfatase [Elusimicrobiota bacterium]
MLSFGFLLVSMLTRPSAAAASASAPRQGPWNVILVVMDAARADHTSLYGYARDTTPALAELGRKGAVFESALAQSDWTLPAFSSIFTGQRPATHGVCMPRDSLSGAQPTLAQLFRERGFQTAAFTAGILDIRRMGLGRGFDSVAAFHRASGMGSMAQALPAALSWLESRSSSPFFIVIHGADVHYPHVCPPDYLTRFAPQGPRPGAGAPGDVNFLQAFDLSGSVDWRRMPSEFIGRVASIKADPQAMARLAADIAAEYDGCMSYGDSQLPALYEAMTKLRLWDNTILVATADHGEELGEHGGFGHASRPLYDEVLHVPLVVWQPGVPGLAGRRIRTPVEEIDLLPTLMELEGWPAPPGAQGRSFRDLLEGATRPATDSGQYSQASLRAIGPRILDLEAYRNGDWKIVRREHRWELFDLAADPKESRSLLDREPGKFMQLAAELMRLKTRP